MNKQTPSGFEQHLEGLSLPDAKIRNQQELKLTIINSKKSLRISLWLLLVPCIALLEGFFQSAFHILLPPWSWLVKFSPAMPIWVRFSIFLMVLIVIPGFAVLVNLFGILWFKYDRNEHVLHVAIRVRRRNIWVIVFAGLVALLFIGHTIANWMTNG